MLSDPCEELARSIYIEKHGHAPEEFKEATHRYALGAQGQGGAWLIKSRMSLGSCILGMGNQHYRHNKCSRRNKDQDPLSCL